MAEYIDREAVLQEMMSKALPNDAQRLYFAIRNIVQKAPAADVAEVKHGKWKKHTDDYDCDYIECSICGEEFYPPDNEFTFGMTPKYCPNCGAKMDGKEKDNNV